MFNIILSREIDFLFQRSASPASPKISQQITLSPKPKISKQFIENQSKQERKNSITEKISNIYKVISKVSDTPHDSNPHIVEFYRSRLEAKNSEILSLKKQIIQYKAVEALAQNELNFSPISLISRSAKKYSDTSKINEIFPFQTYSNSRQTSPIRCQPFLGSENSNAVASIISKRPTEANIISSIPKQQILINRSKSLPKSTILKNQSQKQDTKLFSSFLPPRLVH